MVSLVWAFNLRTWVNGKDKHGLIFCEENVPLACMWVVAKVLRVVRVVARVFFFIIMNILVSRYSSGPSFIASQFRFFCTFYRLPSKNCTFDNLEKQYKKKNQFLLGNSSKKTFFFLLPWSFSFSTAHFSLSLSFFKLFEGKDP